MGKLFLISKYFLDFSCIIHAVMRCRKFIYNSAHLYFPCKVVTPSNMSLLTFTCFYVCYFGNQSATDSLSIFRNPLGCWLNKQWLIGWLFILFSSGKSLGSFALGRWHPWLRLWAAIHSQITSSVSNQYIFVTGILSELVLVNLENAKILCHRTSTSHWPVHCRDQQTISDEHNQNISNHISDHHWLPIKTGCDKYDFIRWARNHRRWEALAS